MKSDLACVIHEVKALFAANPLGGFIPGCACKGKTLTTPQCSDARQRKRRYNVCRNVELAEVRPWLRLADPEVQRKSPSRRRLNRKCNARGILRVHPQPPRTAASSTPRHSLPPSERAGRLCSSRGSKPSSPKGIPPTRYFIYRPAT